MNIDNAHYMICLPITTEKSTTVYKNIRTLQQRAKLYIKNHVFKAVKISTIFTKPHHTLRLLHQSWSQKLA